MTKDDNQHLNHDSRITSDTRTQWVLTPGFHIEEYRLMTQDLVSEFIPRAIQPGNCLPHSYKTHEPPNDSKIGVEQPYNYFNTIKTY